LGGRGVKEKLNKAKKQKGKVLHWEKKKTWQMRTAHKPGTSLNKEPLDPEGEKKGTLGFQRNLSEGS